MPHEGSTLHPSPEEVHQLFRTLRLALRGSASSATVPTSLAGWCERARTDGLVAVRDELSRLVLEHIARAQACCELGSRRRRQLLAFMDVHGLTGGPPQSEVGLSRHFRTEGGEPVDVRRLRRDRAQVCQWLAPRLPACPAPSPGRFPSLTPGPGGPRQHLSQEATYDLSSVLASLPDEAFEANRRRHHDVAALLDKPRPDASPCDRARRHRAAATQWRLLKLSQAPLPLPGGTAAWPSQPPPDAAIPESVLEAVAAADAGAILELDDLRALARAAHEAYTSAAPDPITAERLFRRVRRQIAVQLAMGLRGRELWAWAREVLRDFAVFARQQRLPEVVPATDWLIKVAGLGHHDEVRLPTFQALWYTQIGEFSKAERALTYAQNALRKLAIPADYPASVSGLERDGQEWNQQLDQHRAAVAMHRARSFYGINKYKVRRWAHEALTHNIRAYEATRAARAIDRPMPEAYAHAAARGIAQAFATRAWACSDRRDRRLVREALVSSIATARRYELAGMSPQADGPPAYELVLQRTELAAAIALRDSQQALRSFNEACRMQSELQRRPYWASELVVLRELAARRMGDGVVAEFEEPPKVKPVLPSPLYQRTYWVRLVEMES